MQAEVRIERYADQGRCVAHIDGRVVFVRFALPDNNGAQTIEVGMADMSETFRARGGEIYLKKEEA